eukprot:scaffold870_cov268-Pinguiococcus_pyrenoidosus.AAC.93
MLGWAERRTAHQCLACSRAGGRPRMSRCSCPHSRKFGKACGGGGRPRMDMPKCGRRCVQLAIPGVVVVVHKRSKLGRSVRALQARYHSIKKRTSSEKTDETSSPGGQQSAGDPANDALDEDLGAKLAGVAVKTERLAWSSKGVGDVRNRQEAQETKSAVRETRSDAQETKSEAQETKSDAQHEGGLDETASSEDSDSGSDDSDTSSDDSDSSSDEDEVDEDKKDAEVLTPRKVKKEAQARGKIRGSAKPTSKLARADKKRAMALEAMNTEKLCRWLKTTCELWSAVDAFSENAVCTRGAASKFMFHVSCLMLSSTFPAHALVCFRSTARSWQLLMTRP